MSPTTFRIHFGDQVIERSAGSLGEALILALADRIRCGLQLHIFKAERKTWPAKEWERLSLPSHIPIHSC